jgi:hypothetical protein
MSVVDSEREVILNEPEVQSTTQNRCRCIDVRTTFFYVSYASAAGGVGKMNNPGAAWLSW